MSRLTPDFDVANFVYNKSWQTVTEEIPVKENLSTESSWIYLFRRCSLVSSSCNLLVNWKPLPSEFGGYFAPRMLLSFCVGSLDLRKDKCVRQDFSCAWTEALAFSLYCGGSFLRLFPFFFPPSFHCLLIRRVFSLSLPCGSSWLCCQDLAAMVFIYELITNSGSSRMSCDVVVKLWFLPKPQITIYLLASGVKWTLNSYLNKVGVDIVCKALYSALPQVFRKDELQRMLSLFRDTSLALLGSNLDPLGYDMTQKSWYHNTRSVLNRANVHILLPRSYLSPQTFAWKSDHT